MAGDEAQAKVRDQQIQQLEAIEQLKAQDEARASQQLAELSLQEAEGAQKAAADAQAAKAKSVTSGFTALSDASKIFTTIDPLTGESVAESLGLGKGLFGGGKTE
jgi:hypothetical protein